MRKKYLWSLPLLLLLGYPTAAHSQDGQAPSVASERPWAEGVSQANQDKAQQLFKEGTDKLTDAFFTDAIALYHEALTHWDHPAIHFNMAKALMNLDAPVEAYNHLQATLKYDGRPLDEDQIEQVHRYTKVLFDGRLSNLEVTIKEPGAKLSLDGREVFTGPGTWKGVVRAQPSHIIATKSGFQPAQEQVILKAGQTSKVNLKMIEVTEVTEYERYWDNWKPWLVTGIGAAVVAAGGYFHWQSANGFADYDKGVAACARGSRVPISDAQGNIITENGHYRACQPDFALMQTKKDAETANTVALAGYIAGGATLATGIVLLIVNRERPIIREVPIDENAGPSPEFTLIPSFTPDQAGVQAFLTF